MSCIPASHPSSCNPVILYYYYYYYYYDYDYEYFYFYFYLYLYLYLYHYYDAHLFDPPETSLDEGRSVSEAWNHDCSVLDFLSLAHSNKSHYYQGEPLV